MLQWNGREQDRARPRRWVHGGVPVALRLWLWSGKRQTEFQGLCLAFLTAALSLKKGILNPIRVRARAAAPCSQVSTNPGHPPPEAASSEFPTIFDLWVHDEVISTTQINAGVELNRP